MEKQLALSVSPEFLLSRRAAPGLLLPYEVTPSDTQECFCSTCPACLFKRQHTITILLSFSLSPLFSIPCFALPFDLFLLLQFSPQKTCSSASRHAPSILFFILHLPLISQCLLHFFFFLPPLTLCFVHPFAFFFRLAFLLLISLPALPATLPFPFQACKPNHSAEGGGSGQSLPPHVGSLGQAEDQSCPAKRKRASSPSKVKCQ